MARSFLVLIRFRTSLLFLLLSLSLMEVQVLAAPLPAFLPRPRPTIRPLLEVEPVVTHPSRLTAVRPSVHVATPPARPTVARPSLPVATPLQPPTIGHSSAPLVTQRPPTPTIQPSVQLPPPSPSPRLISSLPPPITRPSAPPALSTSPRSAPTPLVVVAPPQLIHSTFSLQSITVPSSSSSTISATQSASSTSVATSAQIASSIQAASATTAALSSASSTPQAVRQGQTLLSSDNDDQLVSLTKQYGPVIIGLLGGNLFVGLLLLVVGLAWCARAIVRGGAKSKSISVDYSPVQLKETGTDVETESQVLYQEQILFQHDGNELDTDYNMTRD